MTINLERGEDGTAVVSARGELDRHTAGQLENQLVRLLEDEDFRSKIEIDLRGVSFVDSCGVSLLHRVGRQMHQRGRQLVLTGASPQVQRTISLLTVAGLLSF